MTSSSTKLRLTASLLTALCLATASGCKSNEVRDIPPVDAVETAKPDAPKPVEAAPAAEAPKPAEAPKAEAPKPAEPAAPAPDAPKPAEAPKTDAVPAPVCPACDGGECAAPAVDKAAKAERAADLQALQASQAGTVAATLAAEFKAFVVSAHAAGAGKTVVQVNRVGGLESASVDRKSVTADINAVLTNTPELVTTDALYGRSNTGRTKAIHETFAPEAKALGLLPTRRVADAPAYILDTRVVAGESGNMLVMSATETATGKVAWTAKHAL